MTARNGYMCRETALKKASSEIVSTETKNAVLIFPMKINIPA